MPRQRAGHQWHQHADDVLLLCQQFLAFGVGAVDDGIGVDERDADALAVLPWA